MMGEMKTGEGEEGTLTQLRIATKQGHLIHPASKILDFKLWSIKTMQNRPSSIIRREVSLFYELFRHRNHKRYMKYYLIIKIQYVSCFREGRDFFLFGFVRLLALRPLLAYCASLG
jgi:hypothetical protein